MNAELKAKWIEALRSGKYQQTGAYLRKDNGYCCLGVLCDVAAPNGWLLDEDGEGRHKFGADNALGWRGRERFNLSSDDETTLIKMNDEDGKSFSEIADWVEQNL